MPETRRLDKNSQLMKDCGASAPYAWDPEPPDQWRYQMNHGDAISRVVAWVKAHTTHKSRSAFATDEQGKALTLKHMAVDLGWKPQTAINVATEAEAEGLIRIEKDAKKQPGRIYLCASVAKSWRKKGDINNSVQSCYSAYLLEQIEKLSEVERRKFEASFQGFQKWRKELIQDGIAELRAYAEQAEDNIFAAFRLEKKREVKRRVKKTAVAVALPELPDFVHSVQTATLYNPEPGNVQSESAAVSLLHSDTDTKPTAAAAPKRKAMKQQPQFDPRRFPLTDTEITRHFPATDAACRSRIVQAALAAGDSRVDDGIIAWAIRMTTKPDQRSAALYEKTVPAAIEAWLRDAGRKSA